jgi:hypothetical protein
VTPAGRIAIDLAISSPNEALPAGQTPSTTQNDPVMSAVRAIANVGTSPMIKADKSSHSPAPWAYANNPRTAQGSGCFPLRAVLKQVVPSKMKDKKIG